MPKQKKEYNAEEHAKSALFLIRNFSKTQLALALSSTYNKVGKPLPLNAMKEWESLGPYDLLSITKPEQEVTNGTN